MDDMEIIRCNHDSTNESQGNDSEDIFCTHKMNDPGLSYTFSFPIGGKRLLCLCGECRDRILGRIISDEVFYRALSGSWSKGVEEITLTNMDRDGVLPRNFRFSLDSERQVVLCEDCKINALRKVVDDEYSRGVVFREPFSH